MLLFDSLFVGVCGFATYKYFSMYKSELERIKQKKQELIDSMTEFSEKEKLKSNYGIIKYSPSAPLYFYKVSAIHKTIDSEMNQLHYDIMTGRFVKIDVRYTKPMQIYALKNTSIYPFFIPFENY